MTTIDKTKPVMITGATGYVAGWIVKKLLEEGITVHAAVRDPQNKKKIAHLDELSQKTGTPIKYFKAELLDEGSYEEAMKGCELVYHTASPFTLDVDDVQKELLEPAELGTANVLNSANNVPSVKRVVVTSSCAAIYTDAIDTVNAPGGQLTEEVWNTTASADYQPYSYSKTLAERKAWEIANAQDRWDLVAINPCLILGPALNKGKVTSESYNLLQQMGDGTLKFGAPRFGIGLVDVRDVAEAHYKAGFTPEASGRYITAAHGSNLLEIAQALIPRYGDKYPLPKKALPKWLLVAFGPMLNKEFSRKAIRNNVNIPWNADNSKIKKDLKINFRPMKETMEDSFEFAIEKGLLPKK